MLPRLCHLGLGFECRDIEPYSLAARVRLARRSTALDGAIDVIQLARVSDDALICARHEVWERRWYANSLISSVMAAVRTVEGMLLQIIAAPDDKDFQKV
eukprot:15519085-Heterocapsa_arctica.AAC.1